MVRSSALLGEDDADLGQAQPNGSVNTAILGAAW